MSLLINETRLLFPARKKKTPAVQGYIAVIVGLFLLSKNAFAGHKNLLQALAKAAPFITI